MSSAKSILPERLKALRAKRNISQYTLAEKLNLSRGLIGNYEQGRREPDYSTLMLIADFFDVSVDYILGVTKVERRLLNKNIADRYKNLMADISTLSSDSLDELGKYIDLLKLRDEQVNNQKRNAKSS